MTAKVFRRSDGSMRGGISIRPLGNADIAALCAIDSMVFPAEDQYDEAYYNRIASSEEFDAIVATDGDGQVIGWTFADLTSRPIRIRSISVHPAHRRRGAASALLENIIARYAYDIDLLVVPENSAARSLYANLGFAEAGADPEMPNRLRLVRSPKKWFPVETDRLLLREFVPEDENDIHEYASDPIVAEYVPWGPNSREETHAALSGWLKEQEIWPRDEVTLALSLKTEGRLIGAIRVAIIDKSARTADFGYVLNRKYWNCGYVSEAGAAIVDAAFSALHVHRIVARCDTRNIASRRVMEKIGMRREGHFIRDTFQKGEWRDSFLYAMLRDECNR